MVTFPNAKINLGLFITDKRPDGYHSIESVFYPIKISDVLEAGFFDSSDSLLQISGISIEGSSDQNLVTKAVALIQDYLNENQLSERISELNKIRFYLHKNIPTGAGLGGGSADGSFALKMLNQILSLNISSEKLEKMALKLGSDCPFFIKNQPALIKGRGEIIQNFDLNLAGFKLVLIHPGIHISTAEAYSNVKPKPSKIEWNNIRKDNISTWNNTLSNNFETSVFEKYPKIKSLKLLLHKGGAFYSQMSGSGSAVFGIFEADHSLNFVQELKTDSNHKVFTCVL